MALLSSLPLLILINDYPKYRVETGLSGVRLITYSMGVEGQADPTYEI